jgi:hypothetical protein
LGLWGDTCQSSSSDTNGGAFLDKLSSASDETVIFQGHVFVLGEFVRAIYNR